MDQEVDPLLESIESRFASIKAAELQRFRRAQNGSNVEAATPVEQMVDDILFRILTELKQGLQHMSKEERLAGNGARIADILGIEPKEDR